MSFFLDNKLGFDSNARYNGTQHYYWAYEERLLSQLRKAGVEWVLENEIYILPKPIAAIGRSNLDNYPNTVAGREQRDRDEYLISNYGKELQTKTPLIAKAYEILIDSLSVYSVATVKHILDDNNLDTRTRIKNVVTHLREHDGAATPIKVAAIKKKIADIPPGTDSQSAQDLMVALGNFNGLLKQYEDNSHYSDAELRNILSQALQDPMFNNVVARIDDSPNMTWNEMSEAVSKTIVRHESNEFLTKRKRSAEDLMYSATINQSTSSTSPPSNILGGSHLHSPPSQPAAMKKSPIMTCWNCSGSDHHARECTALFCNKCGNSFRDREHPSYHSYVNCPWGDHQRRPRSQQLQSHHQPLVRSAGGRTFSRGRGSRGEGGGRGRGRVSNGSFRINAATIEAQEYDEEIDYWDKDGTYDAAHCDHESGYYYNGMTAASLDHEFSTQSMSQVLLDSGANVNACNRKLAQDLNLKICTWDRPMNVIFGNGSTSLSTDYVNLGPILGDTAIIENCSYTILSIPNANKKGFTFSMTADQRCVVTNSNKEVIIDAPIDKTKNLYLIDIQSCLRNNDNVVNVVQNIRKKQVSSTMEDSVKNLHERLHHAASPAVMARALRFGAWPFVEISPTTVEMVYNHQSCLACMLGKTNRLPHASSSQHPQYAFGECASLDFKMVTPMSLAGHVGFYLFSERSTRLLFAVLSKVHDSEHEVQAVRIYHAYLKKFGHVLTSLIVDAGSVEKDQESLIILGELGIKFLPTPPESQFANPVERSVQTVIKGVGAMFANQQYLSNTLWSLALLEFIDACNVCPNELSGQYSPYFHLTGKHPLVLERFKFRFGQPVVSVILHQQKSKFAFAPHGEFAFAIGSSENNATLVYIPSRNSRRVYWRRDVRPVHIAESDEGIKQSPSEPTVNQDGSITFPQLPRQSENLFRICSDSGKVKHVDHGEMFRTLGEIRSTGDLCHSIDGGGDQDELTDDEDESEDSSEPAFKRVKTDPPPVISSVWYEDPRHQWYCPQYLEQSSLGDDPRQAFINATIAKTAYDPDHPTLKQAQEGDEWYTLWEPACRKEMETLSEFNTGTIVDFNDIPLDANIYPTKFVLKKKRDSVDCFLSAKARLVVCANWVQGVFQSLFAPTVNEKSLKLLFAIAVLFGMIITGVDVKGAFLYPDQMRPVYISLPPRYTGRVHVYWKLNKTLYGLPESPQAFYRDVSSLLIKNGYSRTTADPCMFYKRCPEGKLVLMVVHVDDFAIASTDQQLTDQVLDLLRTRYTITTSSSLESYLGIHIEYLPGGNVRFSQPARIEELMKEYNLLDVPSAKVPMSSNFNDDYQDTAPRCDPEQFLSLVGKLIFIIKTRPDIAYAVNRLATRSQRATVRDFNSLRRIVSYLGGTQGLGITFQRSQTTDAAAAVRLFCYVDAAYATHPDAKSHTGYCFGLGETNNGMFFSRTVKQKNVTLSSTEAENAAAVEATKEVIWFRQLLEELGFHQVKPTLMFSDSASMISLAEDYSGNHKRVKHFLTRVNFMMEQVRVGCVEFQHVSTVDNVADILTKPLGPIDFIRLRSLLLGDLSESSTVCVPFPLITWSS